MKKRISDSVQKVVPLIANLYTKALDHKKISTGVILLLIGGAYYFSLSATEASVTYQYVTVKRGSMSTTVSATGQVAPTSQVDLKPKVNASVTGVYVKAGDRVKTGQLLFRLDATDAYRQVRDAKTSLQSAEITLEKLRNPKSIDIMSIEDLIKQEEDSQITNNQKVETARNTLLSTGLQALPEVAYTTETAPTLTGNYTLDIEGNIKIVVYQGGNSGYSFSYSGVANGVGEVNATVAQPLGTTGLYIKWNSSTPQTNWIISIPNKQSTSYLSNYNAWQNAVANRDIANAASSRNITSLKQKLADLTPDDNDLDVRTALLTVTQRQNALADAQQSLSDYTITAPFDGVMATVSGDIGVSAVMASSNSSTALGTIVTDKKIAQITLNEADVVKVRLGQKANVVFDAIDGLTVEGTVVEINTLGTVTQGVVTYKVKVAFSSDDVRILPNMSVSVDIITDSKDDVLYLPNQAIKHDAAGYYVEEDTTTPVLTPLQKFRNASSTVDKEFASSSKHLLPTSVSSSSFVRNGMGSSTRKRVQGNDISSLQSQVIIPSGTVLTRIPVTIGMQSDIVTEVVSGLQEGERVLGKKTITQTTGGAAAPSITSLFRPQGQGTGRALRAQ